MVSRLSFSAFFRISSKLILNNRPVKHRCVVRCCLTLVRCCLLLCRRRNFLGNFLSCSFRAPREPQMPDQVVAPNDVPAVHFVIGHRGLLRAYGVAQRFHICVTEMRRRLLQRKKLFIGDASAELRRGPGARKRVRSAVIHAGCGLFPGELMRLHPESFCDLPPRLRLGVAPAEL